MKRSITLTIWYVLQFTNLASQSVFIETQSGINSYTFKEQSYIRRINKDRYNSYGSVSAVPMKIRVYIGSPKLQFYYSRSFFIYQPEYKFFDPFLNYERFNERHQSDKNIFGVRLCTLEDWTDQGGVSFRFGLGRNRLRIFENSPSGDNLFRWEFKKNLVIDLGLGLHISLGENTGLSLGYSYLTSPISIMNYDRIVDTNRKGNIPVREHHLDAGISLFF